MKSILLIFFTISTVFLCYKFPNAATDPKTGLELNLPRNIVGYNVVEREPTAEELHWLPSDTGILKKEYIPQYYKTESEVWEKSITVSLILSGSDQRSLHRPEVCLDGQGWKIKESFTKKCVINGKDLDVKVLRLSRKHQGKNGEIFELGAYYVYWWVGHEVTTAETFMRALISAQKNIFENKNIRWGYPSVMTLISQSGENNEAVALDRAIDFLEENGDYFLKGYRK